MKSILLLALASCAAACAGGQHKDDRVWTKEELEELESKWGMEVSLEEIWCDSV